VPSDIIVDTHLEEKPFNIILNYEKISAIGKLDIRHNTNKLVKFIPIGLA